MVEECSGEARPNILVIIPHDLGTHLGCYGETSVGTPNLDQLASAGVRFENHFCTAPFCSPSRGAIFTGKYPHSNGLMGLVNLGWDLPDCNRTLARELGDAGYETFLFGFQHEIRDSDRLTSYFQHMSDRSLSGRCDVVEPLVVDFLERRGRQHEGPFYARVGFSEVHRPYDDHEAEEAPEGVVVPPYMKDTPGARDDLARFHACIRKMDAAVGGILDALDRSGLAESTIVVFTTDHGIAFPRAKGTLYDPGIRTALLMRWPRYFTAGEVVSELVSNVDLMPSLLSAAGAAVPVGLQGRSFVGRLTGGSYQPREHVFAEENTVPGDARRCVRTKRYKYIRNYYAGPKLILPTDIESSTTRRYMGDEHMEPRQAVELYDLDADPHESRNLSGRPQLAETERTLAQMLRQIQEETRDPELVGPVPRPAAEQEILRSLWKTYGSERSHPMLDVDDYLARLSERRFPDIG